LNLAVALSFTSICLSTPSDRICSGSRRFSRALSLPKSPGVPIRLLEMSSMGDYAACLPLKTVEERSRSSLIIVFPVFLLRRPFSPASILPFLCSLLSSFSMHLTIFNQLRVSPETGRLDGVSQNVPYAESVAFTSTNVSDNAV
jgi:hypothetical protein